MPPTEPEGEVENAKALDNDHEGVSVLPHDQQSTEEDVEEDPKDKPPVCGKGKKVTPKLPESKERAMVSKLMECAGLSSMSEFNEQAGLTESTHVQDIRTGHTGDVPTGGVDKANAMQGGLPGLEGNALQKVDPEEGPEGEDHVGDSKALTFDDAIAMLKKENVDTDIFWAMFLEQRGLTLDLFAQLLHEATLSEDVEEMDVLLAVEDVFKKWLVDQMTAVVENGGASPGEQGLIDLVKKLKQPPPEQVGREAEKAQAWKRANAAGKRASALMQADPKGVRQANLRGQGYRGPAAAVAGSGEEEAIEFECDFDEDENPVLPGAKFSSRMEGLSRKYGSR
jgi:hypothetical protein